MRIAPWPCAATTEYAVELGHNGARRVLVLPALFDESNKLRRFTLGVMRALEAAGISSVLPDLPGCNESPAPIADQTIALWREAAKEAARHFAMTEVLSIRGGALLAPGNLPLTSYAPVAGSTILRGLLRAAVLSEREAGREVTREALLERGMDGGLVLAGYSFNAAMLAELEVAEPGTDAQNNRAGRAGRPTPLAAGRAGDDPAQAVRLADLIAQATA